MRKQRSLEVNNFNPNAKRNEKYFQKIYDRVQEEETEAYETHGKPQFDTRLRLLRLKNNISKKELAERLGFTYNVIRGYETRERMPNLDVVKKIADYFDVTADYLLGCSSKERKASKINRFYENDNGSNEKTWFIRKYKELDTSQQNAIKALLK